MAIYPTISELQKRVKGGNLVLTLELLPHSSFSIFLAFTGQATLLIKKAIISADENAILKVSGTAKIRTNVNEFSLYLVERPGSEHGYEFEIHATLPKISINELIQNNFIKQINLNLLPELSDERISGIEFLYTSVDDAYIIELTRSSLQYSIQNLDLRLNEVGFCYEKSLTNKTTQSFLIYSQLDFGSNIILTEISLPVNNAVNIGKWSLRLLEPVILNQGLSDMLKFLAEFSEINNVLSEELLRCLPGEVAKLPTFALMDLIVHIDPSRAKVQLIDFSIQSLDQFQLIPGFSLKNIGFNPFVILYEKSYRRTLTIFGGFSFVSGVTVDFFVLIPLNSKVDWIVKLEGSTDLEKIQDLEKLPFIKVAELNLPKELFNVKKIVLKRMQIVFNPIEGKVKEVDFAINLHSDSSLVPGIKIKNPYLEFNLTFE